jgi:hypothetical protein
LSKVDAICHMGGPDIFFSYAHQDQARVAPVVAALEARGWSVFWDRRIPAGQTWRGHLGRALDQARCVVVAWSKHSINSEWVIEEAERGRRRHVLVPVLLDPVDSPLGFGGIQAADLVGWRPKHSLPAFDSFLVDLAAKLGPPPQPAPGNREDVPPPVAVQRRSPWSLVAAAAGLAVVAVAAAYLLLAQGDRTSGIDASPSTPVSPGEPPSAPAVSDTPPATAPEAPPLGPWQPTR